MSTGELAVVLAVALGGLAIVLNHVYARLALVELALNEGLPPGYQPMHGATALVSPDGGQTRVPDLLSPGIHVFLSRNCHACQRLIDELDQIELRHDSSLHLHYVDRPRPIATAAADRQRAELHADQAELAAFVDADPLPYTIAVGAHALVSRAVTPTVAQVLAAARDGGISIDIGTRT